MVLHSYLNHKGEPQRDDEIDGEERDGEGCQTEFHVCMYVMGRRGNIGVDFLCDGISDAYICPAGVLASRPDM